MIVTVDNRARDNTWHCTHKHCRADLMIRFGYYPMLCDSADVLCSQVCSFT